MRFDLRLTNPSRLRWLLWGWAAVLPLTLLFPPLHLGWLLPAYYLGVFVPLVFYSALIRQPARVLVTADGLAWANPADSEPARCPFAELRAYRFDWSRIDDILFLYPREGKKIALRGRSYPEFGTMRLAFEQAVRQYNQANPNAAVVREPDGLTRFFTSALATRVLWGMLVLATAWLGWGIIHGWPGPAYLPLLLLGLPYLLVWANFYYERR